jgi:hypothetical protein
VWPDEDFAGARRGAPGGRPPGLGRRRSSRRPACGLRGGFCGVTECTRER